MAGFSLGSFAGGVGQGLEQGQQMRARQMAMQDELRQRVAHDDFSSLLEYWNAHPEAQQGGVAPVAPPGPQGGPLPMPGGGMPQQVPMPGAQPMPQAGPPPGGGGPMPQAGPPPNPVQTPPLLAARPPAPQGPPGAAPQPRPAPPPGQMGAPPPNPNVSGTASPTGDPLADSKKTVQSVARGFAQAFPGRKWKPGELLDAVNTAVKTMEGLNPTEKLLAQSQLAAANLNVKILDEARKQQQGDANTQEKYDALQKHVDEIWAKIEAGHEDTGAKIAGAKEREGMRDDTAIRTTGMRDDTSVRTTGMRDDTAVRTTGMRESGQDRRAASKGSADPLLADVKLKKALEGTVAGKTYANTSSAVNEIDNLAADPKVYSNPTAQTGLINRYLFMTTGSTRPPLSELKKIMSARDAQDIYDVVTKAPSSRPLLGRDQIGRIVDAAHDVAAGAKQAAMADPTTKRVIDRLNKSAEPEASGGPSQDGWTITRVK